MDDGGLMAMMTMLMMMLLMIMIDVSIRSTSPTQPFLLPPKQPGAIWDVCWGQLLEKVVYNW